MRIAILSTSLDPASRSRALAHLIAAEVEAHGHEVAAIDLRATPLPAFDNAAALDDPAVAAVHATIADADAVVLAAPVYNWALGSGAKQVIELTGVTDGARRSAWFDKLVTFACACGLTHSYTAFGPLALGLMLDFKCVINPYTVYATDADWSGDGPVAALANRIAKTTGVMLELAAALGQRRVRSDWDV